MHTPSVHTTVNGVLVSLPAVIIIAAAVMVSRKALSLVMVMAVVFNKKSPAEAGVNVGSEDDLFCQGVALVPPLLVDVDVANLLHLVDEFVDCNAVRYVEEQV